jgi:hypothetical protein
MVDSSGFLVVASLLVLLDRDGRGFVKVASAVGFYLK